MQKRSGSSRELARRLAPYLFLAFAALYILREPIFLGKSFAITNLYSYPPWSALTDREIILDNNAGTDGTFTFFPRKVFTRRAFGRGEIPFWNPFNLAGAPFMADPHTALFYPLNILHLLMLPSEAFSLIAVLQLFLGGFFMFRFLREIGLSRPPAALGGFLFQCNSFIITHLVNPTNVDSAIWLPAMLWVFERGRNRGETFRTIGLLSLTMAMTVLGGFPPIIVYAFYCFGAYAVASALTSFIRGQKQETLRILAVTAGAFTLAFLLTAIQTFQTLELIRFSGRSVNDLEWFRSIFLPPETLITYLVPDFFGPAIKGWIGAVIDGFRGNGGAGFWRNSYQENAGYLGVFPLFLAMAGLVVYRKNRVAVFFGVLAIVSILLTTGSPLFYAGYYLLPGFKFSRICRIVFLYGVSIAVLASFGFSWLLERKTPGTARLLARLVFWGGFCTLIMLLPLSLPLFGTEDLLRSLGDLENGVDGEGGFWTARFTAWLVAWRRILWNYNDWYFSLVRFWGLLLIPAGISLVYVRRKLGRRLYIGAMFYVIFLDLLLFASGFLMFQYEMYPVQVPESIERISAQKKLFRISRYGEFREVLPPNSGLFYGLYDIQGSNALLVDKFGRLTELIDPNIYIGNKKVISVSSLEALGSPILDLLNVRYILSARFLPDERGTGAEENDNELGMRRVYAGEINLYENMEVLPRAFLVHGALKVDGENDCLGKMAEGEVDYRKTLLLLEDPPFPLPPEADQGESKVAVLNYGLNDVTISTESDRDGFLFLSDLFYPGWKCLVDGEPAGIYRANYIFRGIPLKAGKHSVKFSYRPTYWIHGVVVSLLGLACLAVLITRPARKAPATENP